MHNEELHSLYSAPSIIRVIKSRILRWARHVAYIKVMRSAYKIFIRKPEGKASFRSPKHR
jgi:hypothetical protein